MRNAALQRRARVRRCTWTILGSQMDPTALSWTNCLRRNCQVNAGQQSNIISKRNH